MAKSGPKPKANNNPLGLVLNNIVVDPTTGCWLFTGAVGPNGYATVAIRANGQRTQCGVHKVAYLFMVGEVPEGLFVCHKCDVKRCVRPEHLFLGAPKDNSADMVAKQRNKYGTKHHGAKLTEDAVLAIRADGRPNTEIAASHGISRNNVSNIKARKRWAYL